MFPQFRGTKQVSVYDVWAQSPITTLVDHSFGIQGYWEPPHLLLDESVFLPKLELESHEFEDDDLSLRPSTPSGILGTSFWSSSQI